MRLIGNKTHGDLAEIAIAEFINQFMYDFRATHVGKKLSRSKKLEEDIVIVNEVTKSRIPVSLKAYGNYALQLSTDKSSGMFRRLEKAGHAISGSAKVKALLDEPVFSDFSNINVLPLIYDEKKQRCNILVFDYHKARKQTVRIERLTEGHRRIHPVYVFYDSAGDYVCEVRYGGASANPLQPGLWTHSKRGLNYFDSLTGGWISYSPNEVLVPLFAHALVSSSAGHASALETIKKDIEKLRQSSGLGKR